MKKTFIITLLTLLAVFAFVSCSGGSDPHTLKYLTFESTTSFSIYTHYFLNNWNGTLEYSTDTSTWTVWDGTKISSALYDGKYSIFFRGIGNTIITGPHTLFISRWVITGSNVECKGDIRTLLNYDNPDDSTMAPYCFSGLFYDCTSLKTAPELPATTLAESCYSLMFYNCRNLTTAPELPATTLAESCYESMFFGCRSLKTAPELPATKLADYCYGGMFYGCSSLKTAPILPATTLVEGCYDSMFESCSNLNSITCLATDISARNATKYWVLGVNKKGKFHVPSTIKSAWEAKDSRDGKPSNFSWNFI